MSEVWILEHLQSEVYLEKFDFEVKLIKLSEVICEVVVRQLF